MRYLLPILVVLTISLTPGLSQPKEGFVQEVFLTGLRNPTCIDFAPDGRMFIAQKSGQIMIWENGEILENPAIKLDVDFTGERGLGSLRLDPNFEENGFIYVYYTVRNENHNRLSRLTMVGNLVQPGSEIVLLDLEVMYASIHNAGSIRFEDDETLFLTVGDGALSNNSQDFTTKLGKVLRLKSNGEIPEDNPFYDELEGDLRMIYASGVRNPYTADYNSETEQLFVNDVGGNSWEEINEITARANYGWPITEGLSQGNTNVPANYEEPIFVYDHDQGCAIVGGTFIFQTNQTFPRNTQATISSWTGAPAS